MDHYKVSETSWAVEIEDCVFEGPNQLSGDDLNQVQEIWTESDSSEGILQAQDMRRWSDRSQDHRTLQAEQD